MSSKMMRTQLRASGPTGHSDGTKVQTLALASFETSIYGLVNAEQMASMREKNNPALIEREKKVQLHGMYAWRRVEYYAMEYTRYQPSETKVQGGTVQHKYVDQSQLDITDSAWLVQRRPAIFASKKRGNRQNYARASNLEVDIEDRKLAKEAAKHHDLDEDFEDESEYEEGAGAGKRRELAEISRGIDILMSGGFSDGGALRKPQRIEQARIEQETRATRTPGEQKYWAHFRELWPAMRVDHITMNAGDHLPLDAIYGVQNLDEMEKWLPYSKKLAMKRLMEVHPDPNASEEEIRDYMIERSSQPFESWMKIMMFFNHNGGVKFGMSEFSTPYFTVSCVAPEHYVLRANSATLVTTAGGAKLDNTHFQTDLVRRNTVLTPLGQQRLRDPSALVFELGLMHRMTQIGGKGVAGNIDLKTFHPMVYYSIAAIRKARHLDRDMFNTTGLMGAPILQDMAIHHGSHVRQERMTSAFYEDVFNIDNFTSCHRQLARNWAPFVYGYSKDCCSATPYGSYNGIRVTAMYADATVDDRLKNTEIVIYVMTVYWMMLKYENEALITHFNVTPN